MEDRLKAKLNISASELKTIAVLLMILNHGCLLFEDIIGSKAVFDIIIAVTRASFVIFAFLTAEGMAHTHSREKYIGRLLVFALISEIPFDLFNFGTILEFTSQNVFFELAIAALGIYFIDKYGETYIKVLVGIAVMALAAVIRADYGFMGIALIFVFYYLRRKKAVMYLAAAAVLFFGAMPGGASGALIQLCGAWAFVLFCFYDGTRGRQLPALLYYWIYPVHLMILWMIGRLAGLL